MSAFLRDLQRAVAESRHDAVARGLYATDASVWQQMPLAAATPRDAAELRAAIAVAARHGVPVVARGAGTSLAGQTMGEGALVLDVSKHLTRVADFDPAQPCICAEAGVVRDTLNAHVAAHALMFAPETSTSNRANIGGMIANNSSGMMSIRYGKTIDHVLSVDGFLADGTALRFGLRSEMGARGNALLDGLLAIVERHRPLIEARFPRVMRRVGGYSLDEFLGAEHNLSKIIAGSEGTLAVMSSARLRLVPKLKHVMALAIHFGDLIESLRAAPDIVAHNPLSAELMDGELVRKAIENPGTRPLCGWVRGHPDAVIAVEFDGETADEARARIEALAGDMRSRGWGYEHVPLLAPAERHAIVEVRKLGLGIMSRIVGDAKPLSFVEDACVPVAHLAEYARRVRDICRAEGVAMEAYGHASVGVLHLKPILNLKSREGRAQLERISDAVVGIVREYGGSWSGEHGDGIARGANNERFWGAEMMEVFREVKRLFDPKGLLNPGKIFDTPPVAGPLRYAEGYRMDPPKTRFHFRADGGIGGAVEMCNGVGACRKIGAGTMCPSYMATREEQDSTRGRANALRLAMSGQLGPGAMQSQELHDVLDLCLECKACKTECPNNVDMARMKSEFLHGYHAAHGPSLRDRAFAHAPDAARLLCGPQAAIANAAMSFPPTKALLCRALGIAPQRRLPAFARESLAAWHARRRPAKGRTVILFDDTFASYHETGVGKWAVRVLEHLGFRVRLARAGCCCRTFISKGFLDVAKERGTRTMRRLDRFARAGIPILGLEPSCISSLRDDLPDLMDDVSLGNRVAAAVQPIEDFLAAEGVRLPPGGDYLLHGHCHQKALGGTGSLHLLFGASLEETDSGCCGMAGSFGYEAEHFPLSQHIGESRLFPAVRAAGRGTVLVANGFSCRHQVQDATGRRAIHAIEAIGRRLLPRRAAS